MICHKHCYVVLNHTCKNTYSNRSDHELTGHKGLNYSDY